MNQPTTALDWAQVRQQYPRAFVSLEKWLEYDWEIREDGHLYYLFDPKPQRPLVLKLNPRDLYDFFDGQGVWVQIVRHQWLDAAYWKYIFEDLEATSYSQQAHPTRPAAETAGFAAAFGVLEKMLNEQQG